MNTLNDLTSNERNHESANGSITEGVSKFDLARRALTELRQDKERPFCPTPDIGVVWVLSAPGTVKEISQDGSYAGVSSDLTNVEYGLDLVRQITALRLQKPVEEVTKEDIGSRGPLFYYNGEDGDTESTRYPQNQHLAELAATPEFPIPESRIFIDHIKVAHTPAQVESIAHYLEEHPEIKKVAVVSIGAHSARVGRYLEHYKSILPESVDFINAPAAQTHNPVGTTLREIHKIQQYQAMNHLSENSYFHRPT